MFCRTKLLFYAAGRSGVIGSTKTKNYTHCSKNGIIQSGDRARGTAAKLMFNTDFLNVYFGSETAVQPEIIAVKRGPAGNGEKWTFIHSHRQLVFIVVRSHCTAL